MTQPVIRLAATAVFCAVIVPILAQQGRVVGMVLEIAPPVFLRAATRGPEVALDPARDLGRILVEGQALRVGAGGRVRFRLGAGTRELTAAQGRFELSYPSGLTRADQTMLDALSAYGRPGGTRAVGSGLYSPADRSAVRLDALDVRWTPPASAEPITLELRTTAGRVVWSVRDLPGPSGRLAAAPLTSLRDAIRKLDAASPGERWGLVLGTEAGPVSSISARVLSRDEEASLAARLDAADREPEPLVRTIQRAFELTSVGLVNEAADELDRAIASTPGNDTLVRAAVSAHERTGNTDRARQLLTSLGRGGS